MKIVQTTTLSILGSLLFVAAVQSAGTPPAEIKLGLGFDRGFGVAGSLNELNGFIGNDGIAIDYVFVKQKPDDRNPLYWFVSGGGFIDWDGDLGARLPVGGEFHFAKNVDAFAQIIPRFRLNHKSDFGFDLGVGIRYQF